MSELPPGWAEAPVGDCFDLVRGVTYRGEDASALPSNNRVGLLRATNIQNGELDSCDLVYVPESCVSTAQRLREGDVVFASSSGSASLVGKAARVARPTTDTFGAFCTVARQREVGLGVWLTQATRSAQYRSYVESVALGTNINNFRNADLSAYRLPIPPSAEQRRIVAKIDVLTARSKRARTELTRVRELAARSRQQVLEQVFAQVPGDERPLSDLAPFVTSGSRGWAQHYSDDGALFIRVGDVCRADIDLDLADPQHVRPPRDAEGSRTRLTRGDVLITITADLGRVGVYEDDREAYVNQHVALVRLSGEMSPRYVAWFLASAEGQRQLLQMNRGATKAGLGLNDIRNARLPACSIPRQRAIVARIEAAFARIDAALAEAERAAELLGRLEQAVLAKAFRGELVPQDPADEPASALLARLAAATPASTKRRGRNAVA